MRVEETEALAKKTCESRRLEIRSCVGIVALAVLTASPAPAQDTGAESGDGGVIFPGAIAEPVVGAPIIDFTALDDRAVPFELGSLRGKPYLLKFFRGHW